MSWHRAWEPGRFIEGAGRMQYIEPPPRPLNLLMVRGGSPVFCVRDATGIRSFGDVFTAAPGFQDFLDMYLHERDAIHELPDGTLPG